MESRSHQIDHTHDDGRALQKRMEKSASADEIVWREFRAGSQSALTSIYRNHVDSLFNYGRQFTTDRELVKDAVQDMFIDLMASRHRLGETQSIKFYLLKSLRHRLVRMLGKKAWESNQQEQMQEASFHISLSHDLVLIHQQLDQDQQRLIKDKLNELPVLQREILLLYFYEGMKYAQIAEILGIKVKSARALLYRGIQTMSKLLGQPLSAE